MCWAADVTVRHVDANDPDAPLHTDDRPAGKADADGLHPFGTRHAGGPAGRTIAAMRTVSDIDKVPPDLRGASVALGNFDGVHRGHRAVIRVAMDEAVKLGRPSGVISFHPHPRLFFSPDAEFFRLTPQPLKLRLLAEIGLDVAYILTFDAGLARLSPDAFVSDILVERLGVSHVVAGWDYHFGAKRAGNADTLRSLGARHGFGVTIVTARTDAGGEPVSSSRIRAALAAGRPDEAARLLGYNWRVVETVIGGDRRGHDLGFPTINMRLDPGVELAHGIYAVRVHMGGRSIDGAAYLGTRPTFDGSEAFLETFLFDFDGDLYGLELEVEFVGYLRGDRAFDSAEALAAQMRSDCATARALLRGGTTALQPQVLDAESAPRRPE